MNILIAEDEQDIRNLISLHMKKENYNVYEACDGEEALNIFENEKIDLILLDIMMPNIDGISLIQRVRAVSTIPIICVTAMGNDSDKVLALGLGADDYLVKPISPIELTARVESNLRRCYKYTNQKNKVYSTGELKLFTESFELFKGDKKIELNPKEFKIVQLLISNLGRVFTKKQIYEEVWEEMYIGDSNNIMVHLSHIREKIEDDPKNPVYVKTIRGIGYKIERVNVNETQQK
ncbi:response regulator transcription factor [Clostridium saccharobutylicum]|uniref:Stage 0 sporulation protein A homolog n=1 Tax=Clostridium saccharobutylicum TaxID=169679 RepID=A0A1S8N641_CLOSA|nr:response regulator transcription factor [Clostridium saccharobutylicum]OOM11979.1 alkaline phosphatase synthesis transcriptional regulatory protein PhoP [Clostridium saccharobutylicum]